MLKFFLFSEMFSCFPQFCICLY